ncbi:MAG: IclR family transcriptional regulator [Candidatus Aminicenantes bacterium]|jgi:IclR family pca regulon transcriptional regulator
MRYKKIIDNNEKDSGFVSSLARGLSILASYDAANPIMGISEIARKTSLPKSTVYRLIQTLCDLRYVIPDGTSKKYMLGPKVLNLGFTVLSSLELRDVAAPYLRMFSESSGETVNLAISDGWQLVYVERVKTQKIVNINLHIGSRLELYNTSMGRVLSAFQSEDWLSKYLEYLQYIPEAREYIAEGGKILREILADVRKKGYAINNEELAPGLRSVAAPVKNREGKVIGAVNVAVSSGLFSLERLKKEMLPPLLETTQAISAVLGY